MNTPPELPKKTDNTPVTPAPKTGRTASFYMALLAIVISLIGTCVSIFEARILREQQTIMSEEKEASVWPYVNTRVNIAQESNSTIVTMTIKNEGVGPALIGDLSHTVGDKEGVLIDVLPELRKQFSQFQLIPLLSSNSQQKVLGAGESFIVFRLLITDKKGDETQTSSIAVTGAIETTYCYCSIYGDCWSAEGERLPDGEPCGARNYLR